MRTSLIVVMAFSIFTAPLYADVLPSRRANSSSDAGRVAERVASLGVSSADAKAQAAALTESDRAFFGSHQDRIQVVGAQQDMFSGQSDNLWYETILGGFFFLGGLFLIYYMLRNNEPGSSF